MTRLAAPGRAITIGVMASALPLIYRLLFGALITCNGGRALALSLPAGPERNTMLTLTHCIVVFSILGQGLTIGPVVRKAVTDRR